MQFKARPVEKFGEEVGRASLLFAEAHSSAKSANEWGTRRPSDKG